MNATTGPLNRASSDNTLPSSMRSSNRAFGLVFAMAFSIVAFWPLLGGDSLRYWALALGVAFLIGAVVWPDSL